MQPAPIQKKTVILLLALSVLVSLLSVPFVFWNTIHSSKVTLPADYPTSDEITVVVETAARDNLSPSGVGGSVIGATQDYYTISGWAANTSEEMVETFHDTVLLKRAEDTQFLKIQTGLIVRKDLENYRGLEKNFFNAGFCGKVAARDLDPGLWEIYLLYQCNGDDYLIKTDSTLEVS